MSEDLGIDNLVPYDDKGGPYYKTLVLLRLYDRAHSPVFFVVEGIADPADATALTNSYTYDEHSCPTNYVPVVAIMTTTDDDPHGIFDFVRAVWMPRDFEDAVDDCAAEPVLRKLFPEIDGGPVIDGMVQKLRALP